MEELLINRVKERDFLFDSKAPNYKDRNLRLRAWEEIGKELNMKPELVKEKWLKLRRCFTNALNRRRCKSDQAITKIVSWKFGKQMSFLLPHLDNRRNPPIKAEAVECKLEVEEFKMQSEDDDQDMESQGEKNGNENDEDDGNEEDDEGSEQNLSDIMRNDTTTSRNMHLSQYLDKRDSELDDTHTQEIVRLLKENSNLLQLSFQGKPTRSSTKETSFTDLDESDMFYLSMSKMAKHLPQVSQAKIKLLLSQAVLEAEIANFGRQVENEVLNLSSCISPGTEFQSSSTANSAHQST